MNNKLIKRALALAAATTIWASSFSASPIVEYNRDPRDKEEFKELDQELTDSGLDKVYINQDTTIPEQGETKEVEKISGNDYIDRILARAHPIDYKHLPDTSPAYRIDSARIDLSQSLKRPEKSLAQAIKGLYFIIYHIDNGARLTDPSKPDGIGWDYHTGERFENPIPEYKSLGMMHNALKEGLDQLSLDCVDKLGPRAIGIVDEATAMVNLYDHFNEISKRSLTDRVA